MSSAVVGVKLSAFNWRMYEARKASGLTQGELAMLTGISVTRISAIETFRTRPRREEQQELAEALSLTVADLFPPEVLDLYGNAASTVRAPIPATHLAQLAQRPADVMYLPAPMEQAGLRDAAQAAITDLTPRQRRVIERRYGLTDEGEYTLDATAKKEAVTRERIRQIEAKGLRNLRHPSRQKLFREYVIRSDDTRVPQGVAPSVAELKAQAWGTDG